MVLVQAELALAELDQVLVQVVVQAVMVLVLVEPVAPIQAERLDFGQVLLAVVAPDRLLVVLGFDFDHPLNITPFICPLRKGSCFLWLLCFSFFNIIEFNSITSEEKVNLSNWTISVFGNK